MAEAQLASRPAEEWSKTLEQPARLAGLHTDEVVAALRLKPGGRIVVIDLTAEQSPHKGQPDLIVTKEMVNPWMAAAGFTPAQEISNIFQDKWFVIYTRQ